VYNKPPQGLDKKIKLVIIKKTERRVVL